MELCVDSSRQMRSNAQCNNIYGVCQGVEGTWPPECTPCPEVDFGQFLANDPGQMQQAGVILSITHCRGVQVEKNAEYRFLNFLSRAELYAGKFGILFKISKFGRCLACHTSVIDTGRGSSNTSLEPARRAQENAVYMMSLALSIPEISGFQICIFGLMSGHFVKILKSRGAVI